MGESSRSILARALKGQTLALSRAHRQTEGRARKQPTSFVLGLIHTFTRVSRSSYRGAACTWLAGPDYKVNAPAYDADGKELPGGGGYRYFGAAKDLPGVRELFEPAPIQKKKRSRHEMCVGGSESRGAAHNPTRMACLARAADNARGSVTCGHETSALQKLTWPLEIVRVVNGWIGHWPTGGCWVGTADRYKGITPDYYGYRDEDDGVLVLAEAEAEVR